MKKFIFIAVVLALVLAGAFVMGYGADWSFDGLGIAMVLIGAGIGTWQAFDLKDKRVCFIVSLVALWVSAALFIVAGVFNYSFTLILAFIGLVALVIYAFLFLKNFKG